MAPNSLSSDLVLVEPHGAVAQVAFRFPKNADYRRRGRARAEMTSDDDDSSDEEQSTEIVDPERLTETHLALSLNPGPKDLSRGFVFGSDEQTCDVLLARDKTSGISGNHFSINVDWRSGNPLITCLTSDEGAGIHIFSASDSVWKLYLRASCKELEPGSTMSIRVSQKMKITIHTPSRDNTTEPAYSRNIQKYLKRYQDAVPGMSHMRLYDPEKTPLMISRTRGRTGREYVTTRSTVGDRVVLCEAEGDYNQNGSIQQFIVKRYRNTNIGWRNHAKTTLSHIRPYRHRHIIMPEDVLTDGTEYMPVYLPEPQETLADRQSRDPLTEFESLLLLRQVFEGLKYLHENDIVHASLYPGSIRIELSDPLWIKLSDVCLNPHVELENQEERQVYQSRIGNINPRPVTDTWSAGVIALELLSPDGLPIRYKSWISNPRKWTIKVANQAITFRNGEKPDPEGKKEAAKFVTRVLEVELSDRLTADQCLQDPWLSRVRSNLSYDDREESQDLGSPSTDDEDTETEEPSSSKSKGKQPVKAHRSRAASSASSGNQNHQPSRTPISKGKQPQNSRRSSVGSSSQQIRQRSMTPQNLHVGSRHTTREPSVRVYYEDDVNDSKGRGPSK